jgi:hypothetical protein
MNYSSLQPDPLDYRCPGGGVVVGTDDRHRHLVLPRQQDYHHPQPLQQLQRQELHEPLLQPGVSVKKLPFRLRL